MRLEDSVQVSVITCLYNTPTNLFKKCLESISKQTFGNFEVLIVNDGSTEYMEENKKLIEKLDKRFTYYEKIHDGKSQTLNFAIPLCKGKYIAICDSDDQMLPRRLEYQYEFLENSDYDMICNAMETDDKEITFPGPFGSQEINKDNLYFLATHPSMMVYKKKLLASVPFLFSQIYDSMEDAVFNHLMFYNGIKMYYDSKIMQIYSRSNPNAVHYQNLYGYKKEGSFKLFNRTFNYISPNPQKLTCILLVNEDWGTDIEKTILSIRFTADNVKILIVDYSKKELDLSKLQKYTISTLRVENSYISALLNGISACDTQYLMIVSKPIRIYTQNWDLFLIRKFEDRSNYNIIEPHLISIDKKTENNYVNENGKDKTYNERHGCEMTLLSEKLSVKKNDFDFYNEYVTDCNIPVLDDDLVFICKKSIFEDCNIFDGIKCFDSKDLLNVFMSLYFQLRSEHIVLDTDMECGVVEIPEKSEVLDYYHNMWMIVNMFFHETKFIYEKIIFYALNNNCKLHNIVINSVLQDKRIYEFKQGVKFNHDMSYFLKNINNKYHLWTTGDLRVLEAQNKI